MTCEVAVMNKRGIALAADSAVTLDKSKKIYHTAEKLFSLSASIPVGIMTYGSADLMNVPWETIIKVYALKLGTRRFDTLDHYAKDFLTFIEGSSALFPVDDQNAWVRQVAGTFWSDIYKDRIAEKLAENKKTSGEDAIRALSRIIREDHAIWAECDDIEGLGADYGSRVVETYSDALDEVEAGVFEGMELPQAITKQLRKTVAFMFGKARPIPFESGVVVAGMGDSEPFPAVLHYRIGTVAADKLRFVNVQEARIGQMEEAAVMPFAQRETIDMIIDGIHPDFKSKLVDDFDRWAADRRGKSKTRKGEQTHNRKEAFKKYIAEEISSGYDQPFMEAVTALPRQDLAKMAEALVSLTAFLMRMSSNQDETVAEPIDVAVLSKGDGFVWVKHKDLVREAGSLAL